LSLGQAGSARISIDRNLTGMEMQTSPDFTDPAVGTVTVRQKPAQGGGGKVGTSIELKR